MSTTTTYETPGLAQGTWLVAEREMRMRLRSKAFLISTGITLLIVLASVVIGGMFSANPPKDKLLAVGDAVAVAESFQAFDVVEVGSAEEAKELVLSGEAESAVIPSGGPTGVTVIALDSAPSQVMALFSVSPEVELLEPSDQNGFLIYIVALGFGLVFFMSAITFGSIIAQSVVEEKQTRIVEILMASVPVRVLLAGKILGNSILAIGQIVIIAGLAGVGMLATGQDILLADLGPSLVWFAILFAFGFVLLAALFAAASALVSRVEDVGSVTSPVTMLIMIPYFLVIFFNDNPLVLGIMSYVPFSAPVGMPMRVFLGTAEWWEPLVSLVLLVITTVVVVMIGSRVYANGLLKTGARVKLSEALAK